MNEIELNIEFKDCKSHKAMSILHVTEIWNDTQFYYIKNNMGDFYTIPLLNILYTLRKGNINERD